METILEFRNISKRFGNTQAVDDVSLSIQRGEFFSLLGPSGCGKTTLLRMAAGFEKPESGRILLNGTDITDLPPNRRPVNTIFQNYALFPHLSVRDNLAFGLKAAGQPAALILPEVEKMLGLMQIDAQADKMPGQLSGGQKQRVAIGRALINKPRVLLLDEPLAALDLKLRQQMLRELHRIQKDVGITFLYVTHDQTEALSLSHRIAVMQSGKVAQLGSPSEIYESPQSRFVASFIGDTNVFDGIVSACDARMCKVSVPELPPLSGRAGTTLTPNTKVHVIIRPERLSLVKEPDGDSPDNRIRVTIDETTFLGSSMRILCRVGSHSITVQAPLDDASFMTQGDHIDTAWLVWHSHDARVIPIE